MGNRRKIAPIWAAVWSGMPWPVVRIVQGCCCPGSARRKGRTQKANPFAVSSVVLKWQGEPEKVFGMSAKPRLIFPCGKMPEMAQGDAGA